MQHEVKMPELPWETVEQRIEKIRQLVMLETIYYVKMKNMPDDSLTEGQEAVPYVKDIRNVLL